MLAITGRIAMLFPLALISLLGPTAFAATAQQQCASLSRDELVNMSQRATHSALKQTVLPGGATTSVELPVATPKGHTYCARFLDDDTRIRIVAVGATESGDKTPGTRISLEVPPPGFGWRREKELLLVSMKVGADGKLESRLPAAAPPRKPVGDGADEKAPLRPQADTKPGAQAGGKPPAETQPARKPAGDTQPTQKPGADAQPEASEPGIAVVQVVQVSDKTFAEAIAWLAVLLAYAFAVFTLGKIPGADGQGAKIRGGYSIDPVYLTADAYGKASLSQLQIFAFTLLVIGLLVYALFRTHVLSDLSGDILLLLGISAAGSAGAKVTQSMTRRLSFDNWAWLRNRGWLVTYEEGTGKPPDPSRAKWSDLLRSNGSFDVYSFQLATVSVVVGGALLTTDLGALANFKIPENILALLGLSNVVYIGGRAVAPNSYVELDKKVTDLRALETEWITLVRTQIVAAGTDAEKVKAAKSAAPEKSAAYFATAKEAARMLKALHGAEGTKFKTEPITETDVLPPIV
jgi:hypothetical protein